MVLPNLSADQRAAALAKAAEARKCQADFKARLKRGEVTLATVLETPEAHVASMRVKALLESMPGVGKVWALAIMEVVGIAPTRRISGLGAKQKRALLVFDR